MALAIGLLAGEVARADCTPASADNVTATCTGITTNQGNGAPGTSANPDGYGYGSGTETGVTVNVGSNASVTGSGPGAGIFLGDATVTNNAGANITGGQFGISTSSGSANVTNSGGINGTFTGISAQTNATVTNNAAASISGAQYGIFANSGFANVTNSGSIAGVQYAGIFAQTNAIVANNAAASISGAVYGIFASSGFANVTNSGSINSTFTSIYAQTNVTLTNNAGASISGAQYGIYTNSGLINVTNFGSITGVQYAGINAQTNAIVTNNAGASITGSQYGILANTGGTSISNAGMISGSNAAIQFGGTGNTLTLAPGSVISGNVLGTGHDTFQLGGTGTGNFDASQLGPVAQYQGFGTVNKIGSSVWTLTGTSSYTGPINVNGGTLNVNGNITSASGVTVNAGGTLGGNGIVGNLTINAGGTLAPGNGAAPTVAGSLSFQSGALYLVQVSQAAAASTNVGGTVALAGATANIVFAPGSYISRQYTIVSANGGINGSFDALIDTNRPPDIRDTLSYDATHAYLDLKLDFSAPTGLNGNQQTVGNALTDFFNSTGRIPTAFAMLSPAGLSQASGETAVGSQQTTFDAMSQFMGVMTDPFVGGRGDGFGPSGNAPTGYASTQNSGAVRDANAMFVKAPVVPFEQRWSTWAAGFGGSQTTDGNAAVGSNSTASSIAGTAVGADYRVSPLTIAGFALAGGGTSFSVANGGSGHSDLFQAGAFIRHTVGQAYITGALAYGWQDITTDRILSVAGIDHLRAEFNANAFAGRVESGYRFVAPWIGGIGITPYAAGQFTTFDLPAYAEQAISGASTFALAYGSQSVTDTRGELGIRADKSFALPDSILTLRGRLGWAHDFDPDRSIAATFQTLPGASFTVNGAAQASDAALTTVSAELKWTSNWSAAATFEGEFSNVTRSYAGKGLVRYTW
jgi:uncharacterized protein with beta-barrel porin domain